MPCVRSDQVSNIEPCQSRSGDAGTCTSTISWTKLLPAIASTGSRAVQAGVWQLGQKTDCPGFVSWLCAPGTSRVQLPPGETGWMYRARARTGAGQAWTCRALLLQAYPAHIPLHRHPCPVSWRTNREHRQSLTFKQALLGPTRHLLVPACCCRALTRLLAKRKLSQSSYSGLRSIPCSTATLSWHGGKPCKALHLVQV